MGWEGEMWSPWGWPPLFGNFKELWRYPGLSTMWSRVRRQAYVMIIINIDKRSVIPCRHGKDSTADGCMCLGG